MNTDNMAISGETIDYGPCAFLDAYGPPRRSRRSTPPAATPTATSRRRHWNLARLAEAMLPLFDPSQEAAIALAEEALDDFPGCSRSYRLAGMRQKLASRRSRTATPSWPRGFSTGWKRRRPTSPTRSST
jgi:uncharacterized protein YdiU (UPF0061 family)